MKLRAEGLVKSYHGRRVVDNVAIELSRGEVVGLLGPNGAGKTTSFHMIAGFISPEQGRVLLEMRNGDARESGIAGGSPLPPDADVLDITHLPVYQRARLGLGYLSQEPSVFRKLSVEDNVIAVLELLGEKPAACRSQAAELLAKLNVQHLAKQRAATLSGGERRRVELARALAPRPKFLLLDEPFTGIDPIVRAEIQDIIRALKAEGLGILITDHNVRETLEITDRAYVIYDARVLLSGTSSELVNDPKAREVYLGERFRI